ncbi:hypothetical protein ACP275_10G139400 [Erythranthe tilingii]
MDLSEIFGFLIILKETLIILPKNGKHVASIAILSHLLPSILFLSFVYFYQSLTANMFTSYTDPEYYSDARYNPNNDDNNNHVLKYMALLLAVELSFLFIFVIISSLSSTATILVSAYSYTGKKLDPKDLFSSIKRTWKKPFSRRLYSSSLSSRFLSIAVVLAVILVFTYPNFITICASVIFGVIVFIFQLYSSVVYVLSVVVSIVEDSSGVEALGKAEKLVEWGQRLHGFTLNLFVNLAAVLVLILPCFYYYIRKLSVNNVMIYYGLFFLNFVSLFNMVVSMAYTVFYFRCKKHHGEEEEEEEIDITIKVGDLQYTKLPVLSSDDIP